MEAILFTGKNLFLKVNLLLDSQNLHQNEKAIRLLVGT